MSSAVKVEPGRRPFSALGAGLPGPPDGLAARRAVRASLASGTERLYVVDDDPTGSQTVARVPLLLRFGDADLRWAAERSDVVFALTNSRALPDADAATVGRELGGAIQRTARELGHEPRVLSRSDSTLRGHFPGEVEALDAGLRAEGAPPLDAILLCPAFVEIGRVTVDDVHWVRDDGFAVPVAATEFARDPVFGYASSNLTEWVAERGGPPATSVSLEEVRRGDAGRLAGRLADARDGGVVVLNAVDRGDLDVLAEATVRAEAAGRRFIYRTGPSFVAARAGRETPEPVAPPELSADGLVVVGSHTALTTRQLRHAVAEGGLRVVELDTREVAASERRRAAEVRRAVTECGGMARGTGVLATTRTPVGARTRSEAVSLQAAIADAVVEAVREIVARRRPGFLLAKGGITSHDVAQKALATGRATVLGQLLRGQIALWRLDDSEIAPGLPFVVFPGNVGGEHALAAVLRRLQETIP